MEVILLYRIYTKRFQGWRKFLGSSKWRQQDPSDETGGNKIPRNAEAFHKMWSCHVHFAKSSGVIIHFISTSEWDAGKTFNIRADGGKSYKLSVPGGPTTLHMFPSFSLVSDTIRQWFDLLTALAASSHVAYEALCFFLKYFQRGPNPLSVALVNVTLRLLNP